MATTQQTNRPNPERIFMTLSAYQQSAALKTGIDIGLFTAIAEGATNPAEIAAKTHAAERGVRILCDYLTILGFLTKQNAHYGLTPESATFLNQNSSAYIGSISGFLHSEGVRNNFDKLTEAVRKGGSAGTHGDNEKPNDEAWVAFAKYMVPITLPLAGFLAEVTEMSQKRPCKILDIAAGHGMYGITLAKANPNAHVTALDWPRVLEVAQENAEKAGVADRYSVRAGSAFDAEFGEGYDIVLLTNFLHHFDPETCETLLRRVHAALKPHGKAVTLEFVPNEDRVTPPMSAGFSLVMLANTDRGDAYTLAEYEKIFRNAGFTKTLLQTAFDLPQQVLISDK